MDYFPIAEIATRMLVHRSRHAVSQNEKPGSSSRASHSDFRIGRRGYFARGNDA
jgi:hypothetical protein